MQERYKSAILKEISQDNIEKALDYLEKSGEPLLVVDSLRMLHGHAIEDRKSGIINRQESLKELDHVVDLIIHLV